MINVVNNKIVKRLEKGSALTHEELDNNFSLLHENSEISRSNIIKLDLSGFDKDYVELSLFKVPKSFFESDDTTLYFYSNIRHSLGNGYVNPFNFDVHFNCVTDNDIEISYDAELDDLVTDINSGFAFFNNSFFVDEDGDYYVLKMNLSFSDEEEIPLSQLTDVVVENYAYANFRFHGDAFVGEHLSDVVEGVNEDY